MANASCFTPDEAVVVFEAVSQAFGNRQLGFDLEQGAARVAEELNKFFVAGPALSFGNIARN